MFEPTTLSVYTAADNGLLSFVAEPDKKPDTRFFALGLGLVSRDW